MDSSRNVKMEFNNSDIQFHTTSRILLDAQLLHFIGGVHIDTGYIQIFLSLY